MKQLLTKSILISLISSFVFASPISSFSISPVFSNLKGENGIGVGFATSINKYILNAKFLNKNFKQKEVKITTPYHIFYEYSYLNLNNKKYNNNYFGVYYLKLINLNKNEDINVKDDFFGKCSFGISPKGHKFAQLQYIFSKNIKNNLFINTTIGFTRYFNIGNEIEISTGVEKDF